MKRLSYLIFLVLGLSLAGTVTPQASSLSIFGPEGLSLSATDFRLMDEAVQPLLEQEVVPLGSSRAWRNPDSGHQGTITLLQRFGYSYQGTNLKCRKLVYSFELAESSDRSHFTVSRCLVADGSWKILTADPSPGENRHGSERH